MTTSEKQNVIYFIEKTVTLLANVKNGCYSDNDKLQENLKRLPSLKIWAIENDYLSTIKLYFAQHNFGQTKQFAAVEIGKLILN